MQYVLIGWNNNIYDGNSKASHNFLLLFGEDFYKMHE